MFYRQLSFLIFHDTTYFIYLALANPIDSIETLLDTIYDFDGLIELEPQHEDDNSKESKVSTKNYDRWIDKIFLQTKMANDLIYVMDDSSDDFQIFTILWIENNLGNNQNHKNTEIGPNM